MARPQTSSVAMRRRGRRVLAAAVDRTLGRSAGSALPLEPLEGRTLLTLGVTSAGLPSWFPQGPGPVTGDRGLGFTANVVAGAVNAIATPVTRTVMQNGNPVVVPGDANVVYVGLVNGGVWKTTNGKQPTPTWAPVADDFPGLSIGALAFGKLAANWDTVYAGFGHPSSSARDGGVLGGLIRSTDAGAHWQLVGTSALAGVDITSVVPTGLAGPGGKEIVLVGGDGGVFRSTDGGGQFARLSGRATSGLPDGAVTDMSADPTNPNRYYAAVPGKGVFRSTDGGATWTDVVDPESNMGIEVAEASRIEVAVQPGTGTVYAAVVGDAKDELSNLWRSTNSGATWAATPKPGLVEPNGNIGTDGIDNNGDGVKDDPGETSGPRFFGIHPLGQGDAHLSVVADPTDPDVVYVGGDAQPRGSSRIQYPDGSTGPNVLGINSSVGRVFRGDLTPTVAGQEWDGLEGTGTRNMNTHADSRVMVFDNDGNLLQGDDGGIYKLAGPGNAATRQWAPLNGNLAGFEFYSVGYDHLNHAIVGGAQDNGSVEQTAAGLNPSWRIANFGDGTIAAVDNTSTPNRTYHYSTALKFSSFRRAEINATNGQVTEVFPDVTVLHSGPTPADPDLSLRDFELSVKAGGTFSNFTPYVLNAIDPRRILIGTDYLYESPDRGDHAELIGGFDLDPERLILQPSTKFGTVTAMAYGGRDATGDKPDVAYVASAVDGADGHVHAVLRVREQKLGGAFEGFVERPTYPGKTIDSIALDPADYHHVYVTDGSHVYRSLDAGQNWTDVTLDLAKLVPVVGDGLREYRAVAFVREGNATALVVGAIDGAYRLHDPNAANQASKWSRLGTGLPNAIVTDLVYDTTDHVLVAATKGRGAYLAGNVLLGGGYSPAEFTDRAVVTVEDDGFNDVVKVRRRAGTPSILEVELNGAVFPFPVESLEELRIGGGGGAGKVDITVDEANGTVDVPITLFNKNASDTFQRINSPPAAHRRFGRLIDALKRLWARIQGLFDSTPAATQDLPLVNRSVKELMDPGAQGDRLLGGPDEDSLLVGEEGEEDDHEENRGGREGDEEEEAEEAEAAIGASQGSTFGELLDSRFVGHVRAYLAADPTPTAQEFLLSLASISTTLGPFEISVDPETVTGGELADRIEFTLGLHVAVRREGLPIDLGAQADALGLHLDASATVDLTAGLDFNFTFGFLLDDALTDGQAVYFHANSLALSVDLDTDDLDFGLDVGFFGAAVNDGSVHLHGQLTAAFPPGDMTLDDLDGASPDPLFDLTPSGTLSADLPISLSFGSFTPSATPHVLLSSSDLFGGDFQFSTTGFQDLLDLKSVGPLDVLHLLQQVNTALGGVRGAPIFNTAIPLTGGKTLGDAVDFQAALTDKLLGALEDEDGNPTYANAQEMVDRLAGLLSLDPNAVDYDPITKALTFHLNFTHLLPVFSTPLNFNLSLGKLGGVSTSSTVDLAADVALDFEFGVILAPLDPNDPNHDSLADQFFIRNASLSGGLTLTAADIDAAARLGFIDLHVADGSATGSVRATLGLTDPGTGAAADGRITLPELLAAVGGNIAALIPAPTVTGSASVSLPNVTVDGGLLPISGGIL